MDSSTVAQLTESLNTAFVDSKTPSNQAYRPRFIYNDYKEGKKVLSALTEELLSCEEFCFSVAFITEGGITPLLQTLKELEKRNIRGRILTTDYLSFSQPKALTKLAELKNITLKMYTVGGTGDGFHTKGYIFKKKEMYSIIIGSANMTSSALTKNHEWNSKIVAQKKGEYAQDIVEEFENLWNSKSAKEYKEFIDSYSNNYSIIKKQRGIVKKADIPSFQEYQLRPNKMQMGFIENLKKLSAEGEKRALLISATGTGKTYASAFALREQDPKRALFLVHREQIAKQAILSYKKVFGKTKSFGLLSGNSKDYEEDFLFATMQMMAKPETMQHFKKDAFQMIVIDEAHRTGAPSRDGMAVGYTCPGGHL